LLLNGVFGLQCEAAALLRRRFVLCWICAALEFACCIHDFLVRFGSLAI